MNKFVGDDKEGEAIAEAMKRGSSDNPSNDVKVEEFLSENVNGDEEKANVLAEMIVAMQPDEKEPKAKSKRKVK